MRLDGLLRPFDALPEAEQRERTGVCRRAREGMMIGATLKAAKKDTQRAAKATSGSEDTPCTVKVNHSPHIGE